jgi:hypothetical protein
MFGQTRGAELSSPAFATLPRLTSLHHPADYHSRNDARRECRYNCFNRVPLQALGRIVHELFSGIAASFCDTPRGFYSVLECVCNRRRCPRCLAHCFGDLIARSFQH